MPRRGVPGAYDAYPRDSAGPLRGSCDRGAENLRHLRAAASETRRAGAVAAGAGVSRLAGTVSGVLYVQWITPEMIQWGKSVL